MQLSVWQRQTDGARMKRNQYPNGKLLLGYLCREHTSCVNKPSACASKGVFLLHNSHQLSFMQVNIEFLRGVALALSLVQRLGAVRGQQLGPVVLCLAWGLQLKTNKSSSSGGLGPFPDKNLCMLHVATDPVFLHTDQGITWGANLLCTCRKNLSHSYINRWAIKGRF